MGPRPEATGSRPCGGEFTGQEKVTQATLTWSSYFGGLCTQEGLLTIKLDSPMIASLMGHPATLKPSDHDHILPGMASIRDISREVTLSGQSLLPAAC